MYMRKQKEILTGVPGGPAGPLGPIKPCKDKSNNLNTSPAVSSALVLFIVNKQLHLK